MKRLLFVLALTLSTVRADVIMYGGNGGHNNGDSINDGWLVTLNQTTGAVTPIGHPAGVSRLTGLAFDLNGALFATTLGPGGFPPPPGPTSTSDLLLLNLASGATIQDIGVIRDSMGTGISIADLALQPGTGTLFGIRSPSDQLGGQGRLYTINKSTGVATLVGDTGNFFGTIAFAPNGTLYMSAANLDSNGNLIVVGLKTLNPANASTLSTVSTRDLFWSSRCASRWRDLGRHRRHQPDLYHKSNHGGGDADREHGPKFRRGLRVSGSGARHTGVVGHRFAAYRQARPRISVCIRMY